MEAVLSCALMHWSLVAAYPWDDTAGEVFGLAYALVFRLRISVSGLVSRSQAFAAHAIEGILSTVFKQ